MAIRKPRNFTMEDATFRRLTLLAKWFRVSRSSMLKSLIEVAWDYNNGGKKK